MASRFWVGGTGTWDNSSTTHWSATSGGSNGASVPGSGDTVTFDGSSGGGTVTLNFGGTITVQSITMGAFTGIWDNSVNNNNITLTNNGAAFSGSGSATREIRLGSATYTLTGTAVTWTFATGTNLTLSAASSTVVFNSAGAGVNTFTSSNSLTWGNLTCSAGVGGGSHRILGSSLTFNNITVSAPNLLRFGASTTTTISTFSSVGTSSSQISLSSDALITATLALTTSSIAWSAIRDLTFTGSPTATNSFDLGNNSGITITSPVASGSGGGVIGS